MKPTRGTHAIDPDQVLVRDVMRTDVLTLRVDDSIRDAAEQLEEIHASGAPVVDAAGKLLGVLTVRDIARSEHVDEGGVTTRARAEREPDRVVISDGDGIDEDLVPTEVFPEAVAGRARIADWMSSGVTSVAPDATLSTVCRVMVDRDVHRVFVLEGGRLRGVISTMDVARLLASPREVASRPRSS
jgi:CBS domain-containing protein